MALSSLQGAWRFVRPQGVAGPQSAFGVDLSFMIKNDQNAFDIAVSMPETAPVEDTARIVRQIVLALAPSPYVENVQSWIGMSGVPTFTALMQGIADRTGSYVGEIHVNLIDKDKRNVSSIALVREWRPKVVDVVRRYPGAKVRFIEDPPGPPPIRATVFAELYGPDAKGLRALSAEVEKAFLATADMVDVSDSEPVDVPEFQIVPDKDKAALSAVSVAQIAGALGLVYGGQTVSRAHLPDEKNPIDVRAYVPRRLEVAAGAPRPRVRPESRRRAGAAVRARDGPRRQRRSPDSAPGRRDGQHRRRRAVALVADLRADRSQSPARAASPRPTAGGCTPAASA